MNTYRVFGLAVVGVAVLAAPAFATPAIAPGPIAGVGVSALALIGGVYWVGRQLFTPKK